MKFKYYLYFITVFGKNNITAFVLNFKSEQRELGFFFLIFNTLHFVVAMEHLVTSYL